MSSSLLHPPAHLPPAVALQLSQQAPSLLLNTPSSIGAYSLNSLYAPAETADLWTTYENLMLSCLRTGDEQSGRLCLERLTERFGADNERLMALKGLFQEAVAEDDAALQVVLKEYDDIISENSSNMPVTKRRIALLRSLGKTADAITALNRFLDFSPTDAEAWAELSDLYIGQGLYPQGIFALEEVLLVTPNAWNIHAKLGEVQYMAAMATNSGGDAASERYLAESLRRFCRSVELCDDYLRGYYGLKLTSNKILKASFQSSKQSKAEGEVSMPEITVVQRLNEEATAKLAEIVRRSTGGEAGWTGYNEAELIAARELLDRDAATITR